MKLKCIIVGLIGSNLFSFALYAGTPGMQREIADQNVAESDSSAVSWLEYGPNLGLNFSTLAGENADSSVMNAVYAPGFLAGAWVQARISRLLRIRTEGLFTMKGTNYETDGLDAASIRYSYITIPILFEAEIPWQLGLPANRRFSPYIVAGPFIGFLLSAKVISTAGTRDQTDDLERIDLGVTVGAGVALAPVWWGAVELSGRYDVGLRQLGDTGGGDDFKNRTISILLGFRCCAHRSPTIPAEQVGDAPPDATPAEGERDEDAAPGEPPGSP